MTDHTQALIDKDRIVTLINRLFVALDERDWERVRASFAPEVRFDMTSLTGGEPRALSPEQITAAWEDGLRDVIALHHQAGNFLVTVRGDEADAFCYVTAAHFGAGGHDHHRLYVGSYESHLVRGREAWYIDAFGFKLKFKQESFELPAGAVPGADA